MNKSLTFLLLISSFLILGLASFLVYEFPIEKHMAKVEVEEYIKKQGLTKSNISNTNYLKDYKQGGYSVIIELKDDTGLIYEYSWNKDRGVVLLVFRDNAGMDTGMKYPPLD